MCSLSRNWLSFSTYSSRARITLQSRSYLQVAENGKEGEQPYIPLHADSGLHAEMAEQIRSVARMILRTSGVNAISLRATARVIGVTPAAIYRYYLSLQALIDSLRNDIIEELDFQRGFVRSQIRRLPHCELHRKEFAPFPAECHADFRGPAWFAVVSAWARLYGLVATEAAGYVRWPSAVVDAFFVAELAELCEHLAGTAVRPGNGSYKEHHAH